MRILLHQNKHLFSLQRCCLLPIFIRFCNLLPVQGIGLGELLIPVGLSGLSEQYQWCRIGCLKTKHQVQQDKGVDIEFGQPRHIDYDPGSDNKRLTN